MGNRNLKFSPVNRGSDVNSYPGGRNLLIINRSSQLAIMQGSLILSRRCICKFSMQLCFMRLRHSNFRNRLICSGFTYSPINIYFVNRYFWAFDFAFSVF